jgi:hypothetical protein
MGREPLVPPALNHSNHELTGVGMTGAGLPALLPKLKPSFVGIVNLETARPSAALGTGRQPAARAAAGGRCDGARAVALIPYSPTRQMRAPALAISARLPLQFLQDALLSIRAPQCSILPGLRFLE